MWDFQDNILVNLPVARVESSIAIFLEPEISKPSVLGLLGGAFILIWENNAPSQPFTHMWAPGLFLVLRDFTLRPLQEWKRKDCITFISKFSLIRHWD